MRKLSGVRLPHAKDTAAKPFTALPVPEKVLIPMSMHMGAPCTPTVKLRQTVTVGETIGTSEAAFSADIHASVSGTVTAIPDYRLPNGNVCKAVEITSDGQQTPFPDITVPSYTDRAGFLAALRRSGAVGMGGAGLPAHIKLDPKQMEKLSSRPSSVSRAALEDMRHRIEAMLRQGGRSLPSAEKLNVQDMQKPDMDGYRKLLDGINGQLTSLKDAQRSSNQLVLGLEEMQRYINEQKYAFLDLRVGKPAHGGMDDLAEKLGAFGAVVTTSSTDSGKYISLTLRRDAAQVNPLMDKFGWTETSNVDLQRTALSDAAQAIKKRLDEAVRKRGDVQDQVTAVIANNAAALDSA